MGKKKGWLHWRHKATTGVLRVLFAPYVRIKYRVKVDKFQWDSKEPYLIVMNHQTAYDQFFVGMAFNRPVYYVASEDIFSMGFLSSIIRYLVAPIPIKKQTTDLQAVKNCIRVAREGGTICIAPEGNRTYHGKQLYMRPSIGSLAKKLGLPVAVFRIEGGYGVHPRWSDVVRKGQMHCYVSRLIRPEEYRDLSGDALYEMIRRELEVDEAKDTGEYIHKNNAEYLERLLYVCPRCGLSRLESRGDTLRCTGCGLSCRHLPNKQLQWQQQIPYRFVNDWYEAQNAYINSLDTRLLTREPVFREEARLDLVHPYRKKELLIGKAQVCLYGDRITVDDRVFPFDSTDAVVVLGKNKVNIYYGPDLFQLKGTDKGFNAVKYVNFFHRYKNLTSGDEHGEFLGL